MNLEKISKFMSLILRHKPGVIGIELDRHGWADVEELIAGIGKRYPFDRAALERIVATDEKGRYAFSADGTKIRANQGHSIQVDVELERAEPPELLWHGTASRYVESIDQTGLVPGARLYVHLSPDMETAVKVGKRHGLPVVYRVRTGEMHRQGYEFFRSANGVWLTKQVPVNFLEKGY